MKKILTLIIMSSFIYASIFTVNASEGYIEKLLDLNTGIESYELSLEKLEVLSFSNNSIQKTYDEFRSIDSKLKSEMIKKYRSGDLSTYQMQDLVRSYNNFIYYTGRTFYYISLEEKGFRGKETQTAILNGYTNMRSSYVNVKNIIK